MYGENQKKIDQEINELTEKLKILGITYFKSSFKSLDFGKSFIFRTELFRGSELELFAECSSQCREHDDHNSAVCVLRQLLDKVASPSSPLRQRLEKREDT